MDRGQRGALEERKRQSNESFTVAQKGKPREYRKIDIIRIAQAGISTQILAENKTREEPASLLHPTIRV